MEEENSYKIEAENLQALIDEKNKEIEELENKIIELEKLLKKASGLFDDINGIIGEATKEGLY